jgi:hypothetical protein
VAHVAGGLFEGAVFRPFLRGVRRVRVAGDVGPRLLLAGWLMSRLALPRLAVEMIPANSISVTVLAEHGGRRGRFAAEGSDDGLTVHASVQIEGGPRHARILHLPEPPGDRMLGQALMGREADLVYTEALMAAITL